MTVNEKLEELLSALDPLIESACSCADDASSFQKANESIAKLISESWPPILEALVSIEPDAGMRATITKMSEKLATLETRTRARLVWADDFEDYIRQAVIQRR
jgi:hypothetical protein|tara:strand:+ start:1760 stop:2068 length:309 start_codon:yes stop_codon:yes gene_type:complete